MGLFLIVEKCMVYINAKVKAGGEKSDQS